MMIGTSTRHARIGRLVATLAAFLPLAFVVVLLAGCHSSKSYSFNVSTGDSIKVELDTSKGGLDLQTSDDNSKFTIAKDGDTETQGLFAEESAYDHYQELGKRSAGGTSDYQAGTTKDGNEYFSYTVNGNEWDYFIKVKDSHTVIVLTNTVSQESAQEAFEQLSLSLDK